MPFAVSQWPSSPDPRQADFAIDGWNFGQVPPFTWILSTTGATGVFAPLNDGITCFNRTVSPSFSTYRPLPGPPLSVQYNLQIEGKQTIETVPFDHTIEIDLIVSAPPVIFAYVGEIFRLYPTAIAVIGPIPMILVDPAPGTIPNPVFMTPAKWDV